MNDQENKHNLITASGPVKEVWLWVLAIIIGAGILMIIASYLAV